jgi:hypothetical protein
MEYNPQQWGRGGPTGGAYRPHATLTVSAAPRQLDDSGRKSHASFLSISARGECILHHIGDLILHTMLWSKA